MCRLNEPWKLCHRMQHPLLLPAFAARSSAHAARAALEIGVRLVQAGSVLRHATAVRAGSATKQIRSAEVSGINDADRDRSSDASGCSAARRSGSPTWSSSRRSHRATRMTPRLRTGCHNGHDRRIGVAGPRGGLFLEALFDQLCKPGDIGNDKRPAPAFEQAIAGQRVQFACHRLPVGADAAGDVGMGRRRRDES